MPELGGMCAPLLGLGCPPGRETALLADALLRAGVAGGAVHGGGHGGASRTFGRRDHRAVSLRREKRPSRPVRTLALDEDVVRLEPLQNLVRLVVENEVAAIRADRQDGVSLAVLVNDYG